MFSNNELDVEMVSLEDAMTTLTNVSQVLRKAEEQLTADNISQESVDHILALCNVTLASVNESLVIPSLEDNVGYSVEGAKEVIGAVADKIKNAWESMLKKLSDASLKIASNSAESTYRQVQLVEKLLEKTKGREKETVKIKIIPSKYNSLTVKDGNSMRFVGLDGLAKEMGVLSKYLGSHTKETLLERMMGSVVKDVKSYNVGDKKYPKPSKGVLASLKTSGWTEEKVDWAEEGDGFDATYVPSIVKGTSFLSGKTYCFAYDLDTKGNIIAFNSAGINFKGNNERWLKSDASKEIEREVAVSEIIDILNTFLALAKYSEKGYVLNMGNRLNKTVNGAWVDNYNGKVDDYTAIIEKMERDGATKTKEYKALKEGWTEFANDYLWLGNSLSKISARTWFVPLRYTELIGSDLVRLATAVLTK